MHEVVKTWHPTDFGFYGDVNRPDVFYNGNYELRRYPEDMWLLRRRKRVGEELKIMVKFYYMILQTDYEFANFLLSKRLKKF